MRYPALMMIPWLEELIKYKKVPWLAASAVPERLYPVAAATTHTIGLAVVLDHCL